MTQRGLNWILSSFFFPFSFSFFFLKLKAEKPSRNGQTGHRTHSYSSLPLKEIIQIYLREQKAHLSLTPKSLLSTQRQHRILNASLLFRPFFFFFSFSKHTSIKSFTQLGFTTGGLRSSRPSQKRYASGRGIHKEKKNSVNPFWFFQRSTVQTSDQGKLTETNAHAHQHTQTHTLLSHLNKS